MGILDPYCCCIYSISRGTHNGLVPPLPQDRRERILCKASFYTPCIRFDVVLRAIHKNGSPLFPLPLAIDIRSVQYFSCSLQLPQVLHIAPLNQLRTDWCDQDLDSPLSFFGIFSQHVPIQLCRRLWPEQEYSVQ